MKQSEKEFIQKVVGDTLTKLGYEHINPQFIKVQCTKKPYLVTYGVSMWLQKDVDFNENYIDICIQERDSDKIYSLRLYTKTHQFEYLYDTDKRIDMLRFTGRTPYSYLTVIVEDKKTGEKIGTAECTYLWG